MNSNKCHLLISGHKYEHLWANIGNDIIGNDIGDIGKLELLNFLV